jgi:hypothetical protein
MRVVTGAKPFLMPLFAIVVFLSSFLLFLVQPMVAKFLLPSFGGTAAVWATCLVFFQTILLAGYTYAHLLRTQLAPVAQRWVHLAVLAAALLFLPPIPKVALANPDAGSPAWILLRCLLVSVGPPFFALSATAPLLMEWFRQSVPGRSPDRLYAVSNAGSLLALVAYPFVVEPLLTRVEQAWTWAAGLGLFLAGCLMIAWRSHPRPGDEGRTTLSHPQSSNAAATAGQRGTLPAWLWVALPACGSALLLALTNQISQDVAPLPLLWVAPMSVYLLTFIVCFAGPNWYRRGAMLPACFAAFLLLAWLLDEGYRQGFAVQVGGYLSVLFMGCMVCHGELYRLRPPAERLTSYYLAISLGGALGGSFVALFAPVAFKTLAETPIIALCITALVNLILWRENHDEARQNTTRQTRSGLAKTDGIVSGRLLGFLPRSVVLGAFTLIIISSLGYVTYDQRKQSIYFARGFYGAYRVKEGPTLLLDGVEYPLTLGPARVLVSGQIYHGLQFIDPSACRTAATYFSEESGLGLAMRELPALTNRMIGTIGLGAGTVAAYGRPGDRIRFYELNPDVARIANTQFSFLKNSAAEVSVVLGDGRLSLEREPSQGFDLFVLDAFAGDSIPMHLLTEQAMRVYLRHLKPGGVLAFHISNNHLDLEPVVRALAERNDLVAALVPPKLLDPRLGRLASVWMLVSANRDFFNRPGVSGLTRSSPASARSLLWTDDYSSILSILH